MKKRMEQQYKEPMKFKDIPQFPFCPYSVNKPWQYIEIELEELNERGELDLDPPFQRGHVWSEDKQIKYIEFCLRGGQSSREIIFNHPNWMGSYKGQMVLVDGKQRLEAVRKFLRNELPVFNGYCVYDFEDKEIMLRSSNCHFVFKINSLKTEVDIMNWYLDLNFGGVVHTEKELDKVKELIKQHKKS